MDGFAKTVTEFQRWFATADACLEYLGRLRWPGGFRCPRCGHPQAWPTRRGLYVCRGCRAQTSLSAGTIFQDTHLPLQQWFQAIWHVTSQKHGVSALGLQRGLGLGSYRTAWTSLHKLRRALLRPGRNRLGGVAAAGEIFVGGERSGHRGRGAMGKILVLVAAQEAAPGRIGRSRLLRIPDAFMLTLHGAVEESVAPGAAVRTDAWAGYNNLEMLGYRRQIVRGEAQPGQSALPLVDRVAALLKRWLLGIHQGAVRPSHPDYCPDEFTFRFNRRTSCSRGLLFYRLLERAVQISPLTAGQIEGGTGEP
jgi:hypothetical protein